MPKKIHKRSRTYKRVNNNLSDLIRKDYDFMELQLRLNMLQYGTNPYRGSSTGKIQGGRVGARYTYNSSEKEHMKNFTIIQT